MIGVRHRNGRVIHGVGLQRVWVPWRDPSCLCAFDADPGNYVRNGSGVSRWNDLTGHGYHALQPTAVNQPTWNENEAIFAGHGSFTCTGSSVRLNIPTLTIQQPVTVYSVFSKSAGSTGVLLGGDAASAWFAATSGVMALRAGVATIVGPAVANVNVGYFILDSTNSVIANNGTVGTVGNPGTAVINSPNIGGHYIDGYPFGAKIAALYVFTGAHSLAFRTRISKHLGNKYGVAA